MSRARRRWVAGAALALAVTSCGGSDASTAADNGPLAGRTSIPGRADFQWVIPAGTAERVNIVTHDQIFPPVMYAKVGQTVRIINEDRIAYTVGPFSIGAHQTMEQVLRRPGTFQGVCTTHYGGQFVLIVEP